MESPKTFKMPPVDTYVDGASAHDVRPLDHGVENMLGPVIVGGLCSSDCFNIKDEDH